MTRWQAWHNAQLLVAMTLVVGGLLGGIFWMKQNATAQSIATPRRESGVVDPRQQGEQNERSEKGGVAVLPSLVPVSVPVPAAVPRACSGTLHLAASSDAGANIVDDARDDVRLLAGRSLAIPVSGVEKVSIHDSFRDGRGARKHEAIDIHAPRGTPVIAAGDGCVVKMFRSVPGGITLYQFDPQGNFAYYYAHLDRYADDVIEGSQLARGDVLGYVGTTGNAPANAPHLHFAIFRLGPEKRWWTGTAVNPYAVFTYR